jgi:hypothetical protein
MAEKSTTVSRVISVMSRYLAALFLDRAALTRAPGLDSVPPWTVHWDGRTHWGVGVCPVQPEHESLRFIRSACSRRQTCPQWARLS